MKKEFDPWRYNFCIITFMVMTIEIITNGVWEFSSNLEVW
jgi:hypothetical protein